MKKVAIQEAIAASTETDTDRKSKEVRSTIVMTIGTTKYHLSRHESRIQALDIGYLPKGTFSKGQYIPPNPFTFFPVSFSSAAAPYSEAQALPISETAAALGLVHNAKGVDAVSTSV